MKRRDTSSGTHRDSIVFAGGARPEIANRSSARAHIVLRVQMALQQHGDVQQTLVLLAVLVNMSDCSKPPKKKTFLS
jgi:hypothetical protein